jgi:uncharacterized membrane protein
MFALRYASLVALVVWLGGIFVIAAIVAPVTFGVLQTQVPGGGRALAGSVMTEVFRRFYLVALTCGALVVLSFVLQAVLGPRPRQFGVRMGIAAAMLALTVYGGAVVAPHMNRLRAAVAASSPDDAVRAQFGKLHGLSSTLMLVTAVGGLLLLFWEAREGW